MFFNSSYCTIVLTEFEWRYEFSNICVCDLQAAALLKGSYYALLQSLDFVLGVY